jgi:NAD(P)-dependent dehydrogenase (short-subunit alcohol dehydrogenase family)
MLASRGAKVLAVDIDKAGLAETAVDSEHASIRTFRADATDAGSASAAVTAAIDAFGRLDTLVNVVGGSRPGKTVVDLEPDEWHHWVTLNLTSTYLMSRAAIPQIAAAGGGSIVNISSGAGVHGMGRNPAYVAAKGGVVALTKALAIDHAAQHIRANVVAPGAILTPLMERNRTPEEIAFLARMSLVGRLGLADDIAATVAFLVSEDASFINGELIEVAGGRGGPV